MMNLQSEAPAETLPGLGQGRVFLRAKSSSAGNAVTSVVG